MGFGIISFPKLNDKLSKIFLPVVPKGNDRVFLDKNL